MRSMAYAVGQTVEVCLDYDLPPAQGVRRVVATFANGQGEVAELTDVPAGASECVLQEPTQIGLQGDALGLLRAEALTGGTPAGRDPRRTAEDRL